MTQPSSRPHTTNLEPEARKTHLIGTDATGGRVRNPMQSSSSLFGGWGPRLR